MLNIRTTKTRELVLEDDGALDRKAKGFAEAWKAFLDDACPLSTVPMKPGCVPSVFSIRRLTRKEYVYLADMPGARRLEAAVAYGLTGWRGVFEGVEPKTTKDSYGTRLTDEVLDEIFVSEVFGVVGKAILDMSDLGPSSEQG